MFLETAGFWKTVQGKQTQAEWAGYNCRGASETDSHDSPPKPVHTYSRPGRCRGSADDSWLSTAHWHVTSVSGNPLPEHWTSPNPASERRNDSYFGKPEVHCITRTWYIVWH